MSTQDKLQLIFDRWKASLRSKDRSTEHVTSNFDELFEDFVREGATLEEARKFLPIAIKAHQPGPALIRSFWKLSKSKSKNFDISEKEFGEKWCKDIEDMATESFFNAFPIETAPTTQQGYSGGKISDKEYKLMRQHADKFKPINLDTLPDPNEELMTDEEEILRFIKERMK